MIRESLKFMTIIMLTLTSITLAQSNVSINAGADLVNRYIWRGMDFGNAPSIQPALSLSTSGFEFGFWGAYTFSNSSTGADELDTYLSYSHSFENSVSISAIVTAYYFPNAGIRMGNINNYDDPDGPGAHIVEAGVGFTLPESFPLTISAYMNIHNDAGSNVYFQLDYPFSVNEVGLNLFVGASPGSEENPVYYGTDSFNVINIGVTATKSIEITDKFSLPVFLSYSLNPRLEKAYLVFGVSL